MYCWVHENSLQSKFPSQVKSLSGGKRLILSCDLRSPGGSEFQNDALRPSQQKKNTSENSEALQIYSFQVISCSDRKLIVFPVLQQFFELLDLLGHGVTQGHDITRRRARGWSIAKALVKEEIFPKRPRSKATWVSVMDFRLSRHPKNPQSGQIVIGWGIGVMWFND